MSTDTSQNQNRTAAAVGSPADVVPADELRSESAVPTAGSVGTDGDGIGGLLKRLLKLQSFQILLVLVVIYLIFSALAPETFPGWVNMRSVIQNVSILAILGIATTLPQAITPGLAGALITIFGGYQITFTAGAAFVLLGIVAIIPIRSVR